MVHASTTGVSGWGLVTMTASLLLLAGLSVGGYLLVFHVQGRPAHHQSAQRRLADQFARGQIDEQEYGRLSAALEEEHRGRRRPPSRRRP